jgi:hypothetical protein
MSTDGATKITRDEAHRLLQAVYYDSIDAGDPGAAVQALHEDIRWTHAQVWQAHDLELGHSELHGRAAVEAFLRAAMPKLREAQILHKVDEIVFDADRQHGAILGHVEGREGTPDAGVRAPFMVWIEATDGLISRYELRPL